MHVYAIIIPHVNYVSCVNVSVNVSVNGILCDLLGSEVVNGGTSQLQDVPILGIYQTPNGGIMLSVCVCVCVCVCV